MYVYVSSDITRVIYGVFATKTCISFEDIRGVVKFL